MYFHVFQAHVIFIRLSVFIPQQLAKSGPRYFIQYARTTRKKSEASRKIDFCHAFFLAELPSESSLILKKIILFLTVFQAENLHVIERNEYIPDEYFVISYATFTASIT